MKKVLIVCLLGMGLMLPNNNITAKESVVKRFVDILKEGDILLSTSDEISGEILKVDVYKNGQLVLTEEVGDYVSYINISALSRGTYVAQVTAANDNYAEQFVK